MKTKEIVVIWIHMICDFISTFSCIIDIKNDSLMSNYTVHLMMKIDKR